MQLNMCLDGEELPNVVECWTFGFEYQESPAGAHSQVTSVGISSPGNLTTTVEISSLRNQVFYLIDGVKELLKSSPKLIRMSSFV